MDGVQVKWSDLPEELWLAIGKRLVTFVDFLRFRSVCHSWRSSLPPFPLVSPPFPLPFPSPVNNTLYPSPFSQPPPPNPPPQVFLSQSIIYRVENLHHIPTPFQPPFSSSSTQSWLAKVEVSQSQSEPSNFLLLHPLSKRQIRHSLHDFPQVLNLLDHRVFELSKSYALKYSTGFCVPDVTKVVMFPDSAWTNVNDCVILAVYEEGKLGFARFGDEKWTLIDDHNFFYDDLIVYKGQFYVVDRWGTVFWIDSSWKLIQFSPPLCGLGSQKYLVESCGALYVVDRFMNTDKRLWSQDDNDNNHFRHFIFPRWFHDNQAKTMDFKVYKLDQDWGRWEEVKNLNGRSFVLGNDCSFSVLAEEFSGCKGNCIYYTDINDDEAVLKGIRGCHSRVFDLEEKRFGKIVSIPGYSLVFWPSPTWLTHNPYDQSC